MFILRDSENPIAFSLNSMGSLAYNRSHIK